MKYSKKKLISISQKIKTNKKVSPFEIEQILAFDKKDEDSRPISLLKKSAVPLALIAGFLIAVFPQFALDAASHLPSWTNLPDPVFNGVNYIWNIIGEPVENHNVLFHIPNIILYAFGFLGIKKLFDAIDRKTWVDKVTFAKGMLTKSIEDGTLSLHLTRGHSVLFSGNGDFIAMQYVHNHAPSDAVTIASVKPTYTNVWNSYNPQSSFEDLQTVINRVCYKDTGEYIFFPVKDDQIFLPSPTAYDLSPHKLDILCQDLRTLEKLKYKSKGASKGILTIGYDLLEDQTEQQTLSRKIDEYYPIVLSKSVRDALIRNGYKKDEFIYVPELVLEHLNTEANRQ